MANAKRTGQSTLKTVRALAKAGATATTAAARRAEELLALIARRKQRIAEDFYDIGAALAELKKKKLYAAIGYASFSAMLVARGVTSVRTADKLIEIVAAMKRGEAIALGQEKAYALARLVAATPEPDSVAEVVTGGAVVRGKRVAVRGKSVREIERLAGEARPRAIGPEEKAARATARALQAAARKGGAKRAVVTCERRAGGYWARLEAPIDELARVIGGGAKGARGSR